MAVSLGLGRRIGARKAPIQRLSLRVRRKHPRAGADRIIFLIVNDQATAHTMRNEMLNRMAWVRPFSWRRRLISQRRNAHAGRNEGRHALREKQASEDVCSDQLLWKRALRFWVLLLLAFLLAGRALLPVPRVVGLIANPGHRGTPAIPGNLPVQEVHFQATDGVHLAGWLIVASAHAPTVILAHGSRGARTDMLPWVRFLFAAGYNVLLYDSRGCGESEGRGIALGTREPDDVVGAVHFLQQRADLQTKRFGALGISLGAGVVLLAAARETTLLATIADSAWADTSAQITWMNSISRPPFTLPLLPYGPALADALVGGDVAATRPVDVIGQIAPRTVLLIHAADDQNATTPLSGERRLSAAADQPKEQWIVPHGGHVGARDTSPQEYQQHVLAFFAQYLR